MNFDFLIISALTFSSIITDPKIFVNWTFLKHKHGTFLQVTAECHFENGACIPTRVHTVVVSVQHSEKVRVFVHFPAKSPIFGGNLSWGGKIE